MLAIMSSYCLSIGCIKFNLINHVCMQILKYLDIDKALVKLTVNSSILEL